MRVLIIPEDFRNDQYLLQPLFRRLFISLGKNRAKIDVCRDPLLGGVDQALSVNRLQEILKQYGAMTDLFILCVDRDCEQGRRDRLDELENVFGSNHTFFAENAWEEIETWMLAGLPLPRNWRWADVRAERQVKERYFEPFASQRGVSDGPGRGRKALGEEASRNISAIRSKCSEDFDVLACRIRDLD